MCNILPKKNWHVLKKENIDKVRRDEAIAAEQEKSRLQKIALAEKEARTELLRDKARQGRQVSAGPSTSSALVPAPSASSALVPASSASRTHINFFSETEAGQSSDAANKERELEQKQEQEKWERKVGISVALGQTGDGPLDNQLNPWWMQVKETQPKEEEQPTRKKVLSHGERFDAEKQKADQRRKRDEKRKKMMDPMMDVQKHFSKHKKYKKDKYDYVEKKKSHKRVKDKTKSKTVEELRAERLKRESKEKLKAHDLITGKSTIPEKRRKDQEKADDSSFYNSQFFPDLARKRKQR